MQKLNQTTEYKSTSGWIVHIYDCNRRLLCALEPSHGWSFVVGIGLGLLVAIVGYHLTPPAQTVAAPVAPSGTQYPTGNTPTGLGLPMGID
ncbi:MAG: hypothetical protein AAF773_08355 [Cyanobacteria bacterium P01_D01_bin.115]